MLALRRYLEDLEDKLAIPSDRLMELEAFVDRLEKLETPEAVDKAFAPLFSASENARRLAGLYLEASFVEDFTEMEEMIAEEGLASLTKDFAEAAKFDGDFTAEDAQEVQKMLQIFANIGKLRGEEALPIIKAFNNAAAKLTAEERCGIALFSKPLTALAETLAAQNFKPNPLRKAPKA